MVLAVPFFCTFLRKFSRKKKTIKIDRKPFCIDRFSVSTELENRICFLYNDTSNRALILIKTGDVRSQHDIY